MQKRVPLTKDGAEQLARELHRMKFSERSQVIAAIQEARSHGDLSENAEYDAAKERQAFLEGRIAEIESLLASAEIIDPQRLELEGRCVFGAIVEIMNVDTETSVSYQIVGDAEADVNAARLSVSAPIARALIGKQVGDVVEVNAPGGISSYEIMDVRLPV